MSSLKYAVFKPRERERNFLLSVLFLTVKMLFFIVLLLGVSVSGLAIGMAKAWGDTTPDLDLAKIGAQSQTSFIYDSQGNLITEFKGTQNRIYVPIEEIPQNIINAVIAIEDTRFYEHHGIDLKRQVGAIVNNVTGGYTQGASTITCQLVKLTLLSSDQNYRRKVQESYLAVELEKKMSKDEILEAYLNVIYLGGSCYGIKIAAQDYFGKDLDELTLRECAALAAIIRNPYRYNPRRCYYKTDRPQDIENRTDRVLTNMFNEGMITQQEYDSAMAQSLTVLETSTASQDAMYDNAYYVEYAIYDVVTKMLRVEGLEDTSSNRSSMELKLRNGGYKVFTALDPDVQQAVQDIITNYRNYPSMRYSNDSSTQASLGGGEYLTVVQPQCAAAVINWHTGQLVAVVGGRSEPVQKRQLNRAYQSHMPVGSSLKPLAVYGPALDMGKSPGTPVYNLPIPIQGWGGELGYPRNSGDSSDSYTGVESMRYAINRSHNTSTAHVLFDYVGIEESVKYLLKFGLSEDSITGTGAGLALGASQPTMIEMATAYAAIANSGTYQESYAFTEVLNPDGSTYINAREIQIRREVLKPSTAWMLVDMLKGCVASGGTGTKANFGDMTVAGKTGTNTNSIGVTFCGMTGYYAAAVWIGSDNYKALESSATGGSYAAPLWASIMETVHEMTGCTEDRAIIGGSASDYGLVECTVCGVSGMLPTEACENDINGYPTLTDWYLDGTQPTEYCNMHRLVRLCVRSGKVATGSCKRTYNVGIIYLPEGCSLRYASSLDDVTAYFRGASTSEDTTSIGYCSMCG